MQKYHTHIEKLPWYLKPAWPYDFNKTFDGGTNYRISKLWVWFLKLLYIMKKRELTFLEYLEKHIKRR